MTRYYELDGRGRGKANRRPDTLNSAHIWILAFGILSAVVAVATIAMNVMGVVEDDDPSDVKAAMLWWPIASTIGAVTGIAAGIMVKRKVAWKACMACMCIATVSVILYCIPALPLVILSVVMAAIGVIMTMRVDANRDSFAYRRKMPCGESPQGVSFS